MACVTSTSTPTTSPSPAAELRDHPPPGSGHSLSGTRCCPPSSADRATWAGYEVPCRPCRVGWSTRRSRCTSCPPRSRGFHVKPERTPFRRADARLQTAIARGRGNCTACAPRLTRSLRWTAGRSRSTTRATLRTRFRETRSRCWPSRETSAFTRDSVSGAKDANQRCAGAKDRSRYLHALGLPTLSRESRTSTHKRDQSIRPYPTVARPMVVAGDLDASLVPWRSTRCLTWTRSAFRLCSPSCGRRYLSPCQLSARDNWPVGRRSRGYGKNAPCAAKWTEAGLGLCQAPLTWEAHAGLPRR